MLGVFFICAQSTIDKIAAVSKTLQSLTQANCIVIKVCNSRVLCACVMLSEYHVIYNHQIENI